MLRWALLLLAGCDGLFGIQHIAISDAPPQDVLLGYNAVVLADHPVGYWPLDDANSVSARDLIGGHPGKYIGTGLTFGAPPPFPSAVAAVSFDGQSGEVDLGDNFGFPGYAPYSVEVWFSPQYIASTEYYEIISKWREPGGPTDPTGWNVFYSYSDASALAYTREAIGHVTASDRLLAPYTPGWHHVVATASDSPPTMSLFYDGVEVDTMPASFGLDAIPEHLVIGATNASPTDVTMFGSIGQVAIYDYALTPAQISAHYDARSI